MREAAIAPPCFGPVHGRMAEQLDLFAPPTEATTLPAGFKFQRELITPESERTLLDQFRVLPFTEFEFHGYVGKRRTVSFGWSYDFASESLRPAERIPDFLLDLREIAAGFAARPALEFEQVLVTEYGAGAGIGWHRDKAVFGEIVGVSLRSACKFRLRRQTQGSWQRVTIEAEPRSAYLLSGSARTEWEHSVPEVETTRYSVTFRTVRRSVGGDVGRQRSGPSLQ